MRPVKRPAFHAAGPAALLVAGVLAPDQAGAHLLTTGLGPFYDGLGHFLLTPEDFLPAATLALLAGLAGARLGRTVLFVLPAAWLLSGLAGVALGSGPVTWPVITALVLLGLGALVAGDYRLPLPLGVALACLLGLVHGYANGAAMAAAGLGVLSLAGVGTALFVTLALLAALVVSLRWWWTRVAVRVAGSWMAASGMLMLGWTLNGGA